MDGTKNSLGHYIVTPFDDPVPVPTTTEEQPTDEPPTDEPGPASFLLTDNFGWGSAYVYAWDANGDPINGEWPGAAQAETVTNGYGETQFRCYVPEGAVGVILNNGNGAQTEATAHRQRTLQTSLYRATGWTVQRMTRVITL